MSGALHVDIFTAASPLLPTLMPYLSSAVAATVSLRKSPVTPLMVMLHGFASPAASDCLIKSPHVSLDGALLELLPRRLLLKDVIVNEDSPVFLTVTLNTTVPPDSTDSEGFGLTDTLIPGVGTLHSIQGSQST
jgi:hypothetical protein